MLEHEIELFTAAERMTLSGNALTLSGQLHVAEANQITGTVPVMSTEAYRFFEP